MSVCNEVHLKVDLWSVGSCVDWPTDGTGDNTIFDCENHLIEGNDMGSDIGIDMGGFSSNPIDGSTLRNCRVEGFYAGVRVSRADGNTITNVVANSNIDSGFHLMQAENNVFTGVTANNNGNDGFFSGSSRYNSITGTFQNNGGSGLFFSGSSSWSYNALLIRFSISCLL